MAHVISVTLAISLTMEGVGIIVVSVLKLMLILDYVDHVTPTLF